MKNKKLLSLLLLPLVFNGMSFQSVHASDKDYIYYEDFEKNIDGSVDSLTVNNQTGFIYANNYKETKSIYHNDSLMLSYKVDDSSSYYIIGWIGGNGSFSNLELDETFTFETYLEFNNIESLFVEYVSDSWGAVKINSDNTIESIGSSNLNNVSYKNNILKFSFTALRYSNENNFGYIKLTSYNSNNASLYLDNLGIYRSEYAVYEDFDEYNETNNFNYDSSHSKIYVSNGSASIVNENNNKLINISSTSLPTSSGLDLFFLNRLGGLINDREYKVNISYSSINVAKLWIYYGGTWSKDNITNEPNYFYYDYISSSLSSFGGNVIYDINVTNNNISFTFKCSTNRIDPYQFQFLVQAKTSGLTSFKIDKYYFEITPIIKEMTLDLSNFNPYIFLGNDLDISSIIAKIRLSNGKIETIKTEDIIISGFDKNKIGEQVVTLSYLNFSKTISVTVIYIPKSLELDLSEVKLELDYGEELDLSKLKVYAVYSEDNKVLINHGALLSGYSINYNDFDSHIAKTYIIGIYYLMVYEEFYVTVNQKENIDFDVTFNPTGGK